jgi:hypothetical protein
MVTPKKMPDCAKKTEQHRFGAERLPATPFKGVCQTGQENGNYLIIFF